MRRRSSPRRARVADAQRERVKEETEADRQRRLEDTRRQIEAETRRALEQIRAEVAELTLIAAEQGDPPLLDDADHRKLIDERHRRARLLRARG